MYLPPGNLRDLDAIGGLREQWHEFVQTCFRDAIVKAKVGLILAGTGAQGIPQFYDAYDAALQPVGGTVEQDIVWNAFPNELLRRFGRDKAMRVADTLWPLTAYPLGWMYDPDVGLPTGNKLAPLLDSISQSDWYPADHLYRPQTEYCEWQVQRESGRIQSVTFTCEPPEYWKAMFGGPVESSPVVFRGCSDVVLALYRQLVNPRVDLQSLLATGPLTRTPLGLLARGVYNPYNRWNTTCGIAHLTAPANTLMAEIMLAAQASRTYKNAGGRLVVLPDVLCAGASLGSSNRNSDVAIASTVNSLARQGRRLTLANPVGICMDGIDSSGWEFPRGLVAADCIHAVRGQERQALRLVVQMPSAEFAVSDIRIGGVPVRHGGQIAECITVKLRAMASVLGHVTNEPLPLPSAALVHECGGRELFSISKEAAKPPRTAVNAFSHEASPQAPVTSTFTPPKSREDLHEPVLALDLIQGLALPGFLKPCQTLLCVRHGHDADSIRQVRGLLRELHFSTGLETLEDRKAYRNRAHGGKMLLGIGFTWPGLRCLTEDADLIQSPAFRQGMAARSALLGDPTDPGEPGHPSRWKVGAPGETPCFMLVVAGQDRRLVEEEVDELLERLGAAGCVWQREDGDKLDRSSKSREHFGFVDGISQPGIRGRVSEDQRAFLTPIRIGTWPASGLYGYPGQELVWPGEFVLGYPATGPDPMLPGPEAKPDVAWMRNGSYLVYNRLVQDVGLFWQTMDAEAARLAKLPGFEELSAEGLASRLVGRTRDGVPVSRLQGFDQAFHEGLGAKPHANNNFRFDADTPRFSLLQGWDAYPGAKADPLGMVCPMAAHIRKVNPRDSSSDVGGESANLQHRILRTGVPFGERRQPLKSLPALDKPEPERGQQFLCIQASIEGQFEFLQSRWMNPDMRPKSPGGHDMLAGRVPPAGQGPRQCTIFGAQGQQQKVIAGKPFITSTGGGYFFVPSLDAIDCVLLAEGEPQLPTPASQ
jgi:Dyp-type peroxidase family